MKERPILFSAPMVHAILDNQKTQTRRMVKPQPLDGFIEPEIVEREFEHHGGFLLDRVCAEWRGTKEHRGTLFRATCPYGRPGDMLWARETWAEVPRAHPLTDEDLPARSDGRIVVYGADPQWEGSRQFLCADGCLRWARPERWRPSIHMPRWASRIQLEVTGVRVERLQDIREADARAEGVTIEDRHMNGYCAGEFLPPAVRAYRELWGADQRRRQLGRESLGMGIVIYADRK